jgi:hypothetical protein
LPPSKTLIGYTWPTGNTKAPVSPTTRTTLTTALNRVTAVTATNTLSENANRTIRAVRASTRATASTNATSTNNNSSSTGSHKYVTAPKNTAGTPTATSVTIISALRTTSATTNAQDVHKTFRPYCQVPIRGKYVILETVRGNCCTA